MTDPAHAQQPKTETDVINERIARVEYAVLLLAKHVGGTVWDRPLQSVLDAIEADDA